eukprot:PhM_4_TR10898/c0_g1_i2/m.19505/K00819/rocD, OAT; ornithine--oxo-acid transaminase
MLRRSLLRQSQDFMARRNLAVCDAPATKLSSATAMNMEATYSAQNYSPMPVVFSSAKGVKVTDPEGKHYIDFLAAYSAVNQGHCHPRLLKVMAEQMEFCTLSSRAFFNDRFGEFAKFITTYFGYDRVLPMNTGAEAVETALKVARKWGYRVKKIPEDQAVIIACKHNFHGRTFGAIAMSTDPDSYGGYGPKLGGFDVVDYNDAAALEAAFKKYGDRVAAFIVEPIQGEAGVFVPDQGYFKAVRDLCTKYNVLFIADEIQSGLGRSGKLLAVDYDEVRPDIVTLGKALSGGMYPVSAVLADEPILGVITPGTHGSTFGGNPLASVLGIEALKILVQEKLVENSYEMGVLFREEMGKVMADNPKLVTAVRGRGLMNAIDLDESKDANAAYKVCKVMAKNGLLAKPTHGKTIRLTPPLTITKEEIAESVAIIRKSLQECGDELGY